MVKPHATLEAWVVHVKEGSPWLLSGFVTGHPLLPGYRRFIRRDEIQEFDAARSCAETTNVVYDLQYQLEDLVADAAGILKEARIVDLIARRGASRYEWLIYRGPDVVEHVWASQLYDVVPRLLALASEVRSH